MKNENNWIIHQCTEGVFYDSCGSVEKLCIPFTCNAHTHGMDKYNHLDFQVVLPLSTGIIHSLLNKLAKKVQAGERFQSGDYVSDVVKGGLIRLDEFGESGRQVLRVIIPDVNGAFPEDPACSDAMRRQLLDSGYLSGTPGFLEHRLADMLWEVWGI